MKEPACCCPSHDPKLCVAIRYNLDPDTMDPDDICDCYCHREDEEDDEEAYFREWVKSFDRPKEEKL